MMRTSGGEPLKTVWVLGAGFSRSLGAPLLPQLLRQLDPRDLNLLYPEADFHGLARDCSAVQLLYSRGYEEKHWVDAEEFLDALDAAAKEGARAAQLAQLRQVMGRALKRAGALWQGWASADLPSLARRAVATECYQFLRPVAVHSERWDPYIRWAAQLSPEHDSVITFNYDLVLERLTETTGKLVIPLPGEEATKLALGKPNKTPVWKMHGSIDWVFDGERCVRRDVEASLKAPGVRFAIGTPGPTKKQMTMEVFSSIWAHAMAALKEARVVVFLGYRFPETDAESRRRLLTTLADAQKNECLRLYTVLGPDTQSPDARRLGRLLEYAMRRRKRLTTSDPQGVGSDAYDTYRLAVEPLKAEDFLSLMEFAEQEVATRVL